jgi:UDP-glucose 4-epimerase
LKILVTGGAGFIGNNLVRKLSQQGEEITIFDNLSNGRDENLTDLKKLENITFQQGDIRNDSDLEILFKTKYDYVFHLSAIVGVSHYMDDPLKVVDVNVFGTKKILEYCMKQNAKIVFMSTSEIYGKNPKIPWSETDDRVLGNPQISRWSYSSSKAVCEHMISALTEQNKLRSSIMRYFNIYGPWQNSNFVISGALHKALNDKKPTIFDSGNQTRCFTYVDDAINATTKAAFNEEYNGQVFNIGNSIETSVRDAIKIVLEETNHPSDFVEQIDTVKKYGKSYEDISRRVPDVSKAKQLLNWETSTQLREGVTRTINWIKTHPWWLK